MTFLKIISFPIRLVLFLIIGLISGLIYAVNHTVGTLTIVASVIVQVIGLLCSIGVAVSTVIALINDYEGMMENHSVMDFILFFALILVVVLMFLFLPKIAGVIYVFLENAAVWLWRLAKMILLVSNHSKATQEDIEVLDDNEECVVFVDKEKKYSLSELRELSNVLNQFNHSSNKSVTAVNSDVQEKTKEIEDIENW